MTFHCANGMRQGGQLSPLLYNVYTDDLNHHLQATGVGCYLWGAYVNSLSYADDMVLLAPTVTALQTLLEVCRAYAGPRDIVYNTTKTVCICWSGQNNHRVGFQQESGSEMRNLALSKNFITEDISWLQTVEMIRTLKNNSGGKMQLAICWSGNSHLHLLRQKSNCSSQIVTPFMDVLFASFIPELY